MAAFTGSQPIGTTETATTFILNNTSIVNFKNFFNQLSASFQHTVADFIGDSPLQQINNRSITSTNSQAYTTYPKIP